MRARIGRWIATLQPADLFSLPVILGAIAEFVLVQFVSPYNTVTNVPLTVLTQALAVLTIFAMVGVVYLVLHRHVATSVMRTTLLMCLPLASLLVGLGVTVVRATTGLDSSALWFVRTGTATLQITAMAVFLWLAVSGIRLHYERLGVLTRERDRLVELDLQAARQLADVDVAATEAVRQRILTGLLRPEPGDATAARRVWASTLEGIVRPLSRQLESQSEEWAPPTPVVREPRRINWKAAVLEGMSPNLFAPAAVIVILNLITVPMNVGRVGVVFATQLITISIVLVWPAMLIIRYATIRLAGRTRGGARVATFLVMCLLAGLAMGAASLPFTLGGPQPLRFLYLSPIFVTIVAFCWGLAAAAQQQALAAESALESSAADLQWQLVRSREMHRQRRRALAHALHGRVQAALAAGIIELDRAMNEGKVSEALIDGIHERITACVEGLDLHDVVPSPLDVVIDKVRATWSGVVTISVGLPQDLAEALTRDPQCLMTLNDVIPELVFNCIKHGRAQTVDIGLQRVDFRTMRLIVTSLGVADFTYPRQAGLGSKLLDTCALDWSLNQESDGTATTVLLPISLPIPTDCGGRIEGFPLKSGVSANPSA